MRQQYHEAIDYYQKAEQVFLETGNRTLLMRTNYNLAEAFATVGNMEQARLYYHAGLQEAEQQSDEAAQKLFTTLQKEYPSLIVLDESQHFLNERQQRALNYLYEHEAITNREYQQLNDVSQKQAVRDLNQMVEMTLLVRKGRGRATRYMLDSTESIVSSK